MVKIDQHISDLLYDHDCVIVPEMGGFLGSYSPASIHPVQHTLSPPSKKIAFNVFLKHNDGLLANYVSQREHLSYNDAVKKIKGYVEQYYHELEGGQKFIIEKVGTLYMDGERHIQFEPFNPERSGVNYLRASFGFSAIQCLPVSEETVSNKKDFIKSRPAVRFTPKTLSKPKKVNMVNALLLMGSILWFGLNVYFVSPSKINFASLNPFDTVLHKEPVNVIPNVTKAPQPTTPVETVDAKSSQPLIEKKDTTTESINVNPSSESSVKGNESISTNNNFFLIGGAFRSTTNATKLADELKTKGFADASIVESENGFKLVYFKSFNNREEAFAALNQLKEDKKEGWIYSRR